MNGIINIYKEKNMTSHDVVSSVRRILCAKHVGHLGTLDPLAEGVLIVMVGNATKLAPFLEDDYKVYEAEVILGFTTTTYDLEGEKSPIEDTSFITEEEIDRVLNSFIGKQLQEAPIYSAIKVAGKKLYEYARKSEEVTLPKREITIHSIKRINTLKRDGFITSFKIITKVSRGTYIRSLCYDIGKKLGVNSCMGSLVRVQSGNFKLNDAVKLEEISLENPHLIKSLECLSSYYQFNCSENNEIHKKVINGMKISSKTFTEHHDYIVFTDSDNLLAVYKYIEVEKPYYQAVRVWK